jgi:hypothetical protein
MGTDGRFSGTRVYGYGGGWLSSRMDGCSAMLQGYPASLTTNPSDMDGGLFPRDLPSLKGSKGRLQFCPLEQFNVFQKKPVTQGSDYKNLLVLNKIIICSN